jgi:hypothetical protein
MAINCSTTVRTAVATSVSTATSQMTAIPGVGSPAAVFSTSDPSRSSSGGAPRPGAASPRGAAVDSGHGDHGCARQGGSAAPASTRSRNLPDLSLLGHAAGVSGHAPCPKPRPSVGSSQRCREGWQDTRYSPAAAVTQHLDRYVAEYLPTEADTIKSDTSLFWSTFRRSSVVLLGLGALGLGFGSRRLRRRS